MSSHWRNKAHRDSQRFSFEPTGHPILCSFSNVPLMGGRQGALGREPACARPNPEVRTVR